MNNIGFVFPGQGSQKLGMLADLAANFSAVEEVFAEASAVLDKDLWEVSQTDQNEQLNQTDITQPVLLAASVALWRVWQGQQGAQPSILAGHSLGEYSALVCSGVLAFGDAIQLVHQRGRYMQAAVSAGTGKMAAIIGLDDGKIAGLCEQAAQGQVVSAANFNSPGQTVIAGDVDAVERAMVLCVDAGAKRALPLNVSVPSHCELMRPAAEQLQTELERVQFNSPQIPVVQNVNGEICEDPKLIKENLIKQLYAPVLWVDSVKYMRANGVDTILECGPGKVLSGLIRRIEPDINCFSSEDPEDLTSAITELSP
ncbi:MAG: [acyl-carrier-protein] S-malonyltransferase [SAR86 cluster bacterium]|uniref:Malonyl CoA-acyl carrier protein transacylase n=1 Tax=SAR86 cluster bacterium TaxID=2030880 RepID=A0A2A4X1C8_9GAMM|nr:MAG: [acyl-carrier-protein] S-malonyltransferase [SAR86 cluster bacterium]